MNKTFVPVWNVNSQKDFAPVAKRLGEYGIPYKLGQSGAQVPFHAPVMVPKHHAKRAIETISANFGRRGGGDFDFEVV